MVYLNEGEGEQYEQNKSSLQPVFPIIELQQITFYICLSRWLESFFSGTVATGAANDVNKGLQGLPWQSSFCSTLPLPFLTTIQIHGYVHETSMWQE